MGRPINSVARMLATSVDRSGDCWLWTGPKGTNGHAKASIGGQFLMGHRVFYEHYKRPIPAGHVVSPCAKAKNCVNPEHLQAISHVERTHRSKCAAGINAAKESCVRGHPLSGGNLYVTPDGRRQCRACRRRAAEKHRLGE